MKYVFLICSAAILAFFGCSDEGKASGKKIIPDVTEKDAGFSFVPNQLLANSWYKPGGSHINGHLDESFGNADLWPELIGHLKESGGAFSIFAAEIGHLSTESGILPLLKEEGIPVSVEMPGFTQCISGSKLGAAELNGEAVDGSNIFAAIFGIVNPVDRADPDGKGWFYTRNRQKLIPDEILFDERQPNLCPQFDPNVLASATGTWEERKAAAKINNGCPSYDLPFDELLAGLRRDYVDFLDVAREKWGADMPQVSIHWNVNPGWEWRDQNAMDAINAAHPDYFRTADNYWRMVWDYPQYNSVEYCNLLVDALTAAGYKPARVLMDVDWTYNVPYITEVLKRHKTALASRGVQMGINIVEASIADNQVLVYRMGTLSSQTSSNAPNILYENTLIAITSYLIGSGIYEKGMQMRVGSWSHRPYEKGVEVDENIPGSMAHTANAIYDLIKNLSSM